MCIYKPFEKMLHISKKLHCLLAAYIALHTMANFVIYMFYVHTRRFLLKL